MGGKAGMPSFCRVLGLLLLRIRTILLRNHYWQATTLRAQCYRRRRARAGPRSVVPRFAATPLCRTVLFAVRQVADLQVYRSTLPGCAVSLTLLLPLPCCDSCCASGQKDHRALCCLRRPSSVLLRCALLCCVPTPLLPPSAVPLLFIRTRRSSSALLPATTVLCTAPQRTSRTRTGRRTRTRWRSECGKVCIVWESVGMWRILGEGGEISRAVPTKKALHSLVLLAIFILCSRVARRTASDRKQPITYMSSITCTPCSEVARQEDGN